MKAAAGRGEHGGQGDRPGAFPWDVVMHVGLCLPATLAEEVAQVAVENALRTDRISRRAISFAVSPTERELEVGDVVSLPDGPDGSFIIERVEDGEVRRIEARRHEALVPVRHLATGVVRRGSGGAGGGGASDAFRPVLHFLDLPRLTDAPPESFACIAAYCRPWRRITLSSSLSGEGYRTRTAIDRPARVGTLSANLLPGVCGRFDHAGSLELDLHFGGLSSKNELSVLTGENRIAVRAVNGIWEVIGFLAAAEVVPGRWRLSGLLRGLAGTEDATAAGTPAGSPCVVLDEAVVALGLGSEERGRPLNWMAETRSGASGRSGPHVFAGGMRAQTPLAPVHIEAKRDGGGDIAITWIRRGRVDADSWDGIDIPLDEPEERYLIEIMAGGEARRQIETATSSCLYPAAAQLEDFGTLPGLLDLRIRQMGRAVPLGSPALARINL